MKEKRAVDSFFAAIPLEGVTFDDLSLIPQYADFLPADTDISTQLTRHIRNNIPFISASMDTVTESKMAIAMAMLGGIGIIHKNMDTAQQCEQVEAVKHYLNGLILHPITFHASETLKKVKERKAQKGFNFSGFPILNNKDKLVGILTAADMKFVSDQNVTIEKIMTTKVITAGPDTSLEEAYKIMQHDKIGKLPLVKNGYLIGLYSFTDVSTLIENAKPLFNRDSKHRLSVGAAISSNDEERAEALAEKEVDVLVIDTAHGHSKGVLQMCRWLKKHFDRIDIIAGNIATEEAAIALQKAGADAVKVGIGPGSICTTRVIAGVGIPQVSAIYKCAKALNSSIPVIADGGIRYTGDVAKAIVAGADTVMMGSVLAGTEESPGEKIIHQGRQYVIYRGMGSLGAFESAIGSRERYEQADLKRADWIPQGVEGMVPYAGTVEKVLKQFIGGLRTSLGYCGCRTIGQFKENGNFVHISSSGIREAHPHDVKIIKEAPNYTLNF